MARLEEGVHHITGFEIESRITKYSWWKKSLKGYLMSPLPTRFQLGKNRAIIDIDK